MRTTIDKVGRLVVPKALRDRLGLHSGEVEITADGASLRVEPVFDDSLVEKGGRLVIPASNATITDEFVRELSRIMSIMQPLCVPLATVTWVSRVMPHSRHSRS